MGNNLKRSYDKAYQSDALIKRKEIKIVENG